MNGTLPPRNLTLLREYVAEVQALDPTEPRLDVPNTFLQAGETYTFAATLEEAGSGWRLRPERWR